MRCGVGGIQSKHVLTLTRQLMVAALAFVAPVRLSVAASDAAARSDFGDVAATATESVLRQLYPGTVVEWSADEARLVAPGEAPRRVVLSGFKQRPEKSGFLFAAGLEFADEVALAAKGTRIDASDRALCRVLAFRSDMSGRLLAHKEAFLDATAIATECDHLSLGLAAASSWPPLEVFYRGTYRSGDSLVWITWSAVVDLERMQVTSRVPMELESEQPGSGRVSDRVQVHRVDSGNIEVREWHGKKAVQYPCEGHCVIEGDRLLKLWLK
jgi:hypothetical protein